MKSAPNRRKSAILRHIESEMRRLEIGRAQLEIASGLSRTTIDEILRGARAVGVMAAMKLDRAFGTADDRTVELMAEADGGGK